MHSSVAFALSTVVFCEGVSANNVYKVPQATPTIISSTEVSALFSTVLPVATSFSTSSFAQTTATIGPIIPIVSLASTVLPTNVDCTSVFTPLAVPSVHPYAIPLETPSENHFSAHQEQVHATQETVSAIQTDVLLQSVPTVPEIQMPLNEVPIIIETPPSTLLLPMPTGNSPAQTTTKRRKCKHRKQGLSTSREIEVPAYSTGSSPRETPGFTGDEFALETIESSPESTHAIEEILPSSPESINRNTHMVVPSGTQSVTYAPAYVTFAPTPEVSPHATMKTQSLYPKLEGAIDSTPEGIIGVHQTRKMDTYPTLMADINHPVAANKPMPTFAEGGHGSIYSSASTNSIFASILFALLPALF